MLSAEADDSAWREPRTRHPNGCHPMVGSPKQSSHGHMTQRGERGQIGHWPHRHHDERHGAGEYGHRAGDDDGDAAHRGASERFERSGARSGAPPRVSPVERLAAHGWVLLFVIGLAALVLGLLIVSWPDRTLRVVGVLFGLYLVITGVMELIAGFSRGMDAGMRVLTVLAGVVSIILGLICFRSRFESTVLLGLWIGFGLLIRGIVRATSGAASPSRGGRGAQVLGGVLIAAAGAVLVLAPIASLRTLTLIAGIWLAVIGGWQMIESLLVRRRSHQLIGARR
jgi:uncharacterized membrane protein HdeD (DUF308 family)